MTVSITVPEATSHNSVVLAMKIIEGFKAIMDEMPNAHVTIDIGESLIGYRFNFPVAGRKNLQKANFWSGYQPGKAMNGVERNMRETGQRLLPILSRIMLHQQAIAESRIPLSDITVPSMFREMLEKEGLSGAQFFECINHKTTSWNDGASSNYGRKVKRLPLRLMTAGEFKNDALEIIELKAPSGASISFIHGGATPIYYFEGKIPEIISEPLIGHPLTELIEAPELEPYAHHLIIQGYEYPKYGLNYVKLSSVISRPLGDSDEGLPAIVATIKERLEHWLCIPLDEPEE